MIAFRVLVLVAVIHFSVACLVYGQVYDISSHRLSYAVVSFYREGSLYSKILANDTGWYETELPQGRYVVLAYKPGDNLVSNETIFVSNNTRYDIILYPVVDYEEIPENITLPGLGYLPNDMQIYSPESKETSTQTMFLFLITFLLLSIFVIILWKSRKVYRPKERDEEKVLDILKRNNGRMKQKEIVRETGWSEAKVSLVLKSLVKKGKVRRKKIGREKIVMIQDMGDKRELV